MLKRLLARISSHPHYQRCVPKYKTGNDLLAAPLVGPGIGIAIVQAYGDVLCGGPLVDIVHGDRNINPDSARSATSSTVFWRQDVLGQVWAGCFGATH